MVQNPQINVRMDEDLLKRLDDWRRKQPDLPGRPEAIRRIVDQELAPEPKTRRRS
jgi:metal-responsive CopG/Arc/MetJ family transcriptional regulator